MQWGKPVSCKLLTTLPPIFVCLRSAVARGKKPRFLVSSKCHPQTIAVCQTRADGLGLKVGSDVAENGAGRTGREVARCAAQWVPHPGGLPQSDNVRIAACLSVSLASR